ncbi:MAG: C39 family peptidase [Armatimonadota bacterium]
MRQNVYVLILLILGIASRISPAWAGEVRLPIGMPGGGFTLTEQVKSVKELREDGITLQKLDYSCGSAALSTLFTSFLREPYSETEIIEFLVRTGDLKKILIRKGFSMLDLKRFAESHGVEAIGYALDYDSLQEFDCPVLVPLYRKDTDLRHFVIFRGIKGDRVFLADPAVGRRTMLRAEFEAEWNPKVGMVFARPGALSAADNPMKLEPEDDIYLSSSTLRAVALQSALQFIHQANEF